MKPAGRFTNSQRLVWVVLTEVVILQLLALMVAGADAMPVLTTTLPVMLGLVYGWTHVTNWAEVRGSSIGNPPAPPTPAKQEVNVNVATDKPPESE